MAVGGFLEDAWNAATDVVTSAVDVVRGLPGGSWVEAAVNQGAEWTRDFARTDVGVVTLRALATTIYGPLAYQIGPWFGPQLASVVWAIPGLARGDSFTESWVSEFSYRAAKTAEIVGSEVTSQAFAKMKPALDSLVAKATARFPDLPLEEAFARLNLTPAAIARELGIREDLAALAIEWIQQQKIFDLETFGIVDGKGPLTRSQAQAIATASKLFQPLAKPITRAQAVVLSASEGANASYARPLIERALDVGGAPPSARKTASDVALVGVISVAAATFAWWYFGQRRRT